MGYKAGYEIGYEHGDNDGYEQGYRHGIKEFAKRLKERLNSDYVNGKYNTHKGKINESDIEELLKEYENNEKDN